MYIANEEEQKIEMKYTEYVAYRYILLRAMIFGMKKNFKDDIIIRCFQRQTRWTCF